MKKKYVFGMALAFAAVMNMTAYAENWDTSRYLYEPTTNENGWITGWTWQDTNGDGVFESYYYENGFLRTNQITPDGYTVNDQGQWTVDGVVQIKTREETAQNTTANIGNSNINGVNHSAGYDPAHPLKNVIDIWDLRLTDTTYKTITSYNVHAMLTGQMDQYFAPPVGDYVSPRGNHIYTTQEDYDEARMLENALYDWFCNWLNGMDFEHMTEMERAKEIQKVMAQVKYKRYETSTKYAYYHPLIDHEGDCFETAMTACSLAKALGLKSAVNGTGNHAVYYIQVDGVAYFGQDDVLNLNTPTTDTVFCR